MNTRTAVLATILLMGCSEYEFTGDASIQGEPNPPDLATPVKTDRIVQVTVPSVDVLWVIDNSCSMSEEQTALAENFPKFMNYFSGSGLDYHVGVISTDMSSSDHFGKLRQDDISGLRFIDTGVPDPVPVFQRMAQMGTSGSATEKGRAAIRTALVDRADTFNTGFYRDDAFLSIVVISDEDDYSGTNPISLPNFISWLDTLKPEPDMVSFSSIVGPPGSCPTAFESGDEYLAVTDAIGGIAWSICDTNWDAALEELGMQAAGLKREFFLTEIPVEDSIAVWVQEDGSTLEFEAGTDWTYTRSRNSITFSSFVPQPLSEVFIEYEILAGKQDDGGDAPDDTGLDTGAL